MLIPYANSDEVFLAGAEAVGFLLAVLSDT